MDQDAVHDGIRSHGGTRHPMGVRPQDARGDPAVEFDALTAHRQDIDHEITELRVGRNTRVASGPQT
jgi:hypothetical protein